MKMYQNNRRREWCAVAAVALSAVALLVSGCSGGRITTKINDEVAQQHFTKVLVIGGFGAGYDNRLAEKVACEQIEKETKCRCVGFGELTSLVEDSSYEAVTNDTSLNGLDGILLLSRGGTTEELLKTIPTSWNLGTASYTRTMHGSLATTDAISSDDVEAALFSIGDHKFVWYASALSKNNVYADAKDLVAYTSEKTVRKLAKDGVLR